MFNFLFSRHRPFIYTPMTEKKYKFLAFRKIMKHVDCMIRHFIYYFFVILISSVQRFQTLNENKSDDDDIDHKDTWKSVTTFLTLFHHRLSIMFSLHFLYSPFSPSKYLKTKYKHALQTHAHIYAQATHTYYVVIYLQILDRTQMIRFIQGRNHYCLPSSI